MFTGLNLEEQLQTSYHTIVTDHPYMHEIGLSAFTTGELYNWMIKQNSTGFINLRLIDQVIWKPEDIRKKLKKPEDAKENMLLAARLILGSQDTAPGKPQTKERYYFTSPRTTENPKLPQMRPVEYVKFNNKAWEKWTYTNKNGTTSYVAKDLDFGYFAGKVFETTDYTPLAGNPSVPYQLNWQLPQLGYHLDDRISHIIEMNNYARLLNAIYPESEWNRYSHLASSSAIAEFVRDIKASKEQCIQWEGYVPFVLNFDGINTTSRCVKWEKVKYKLYLYDMATPKDASRKITFTNDFTIVGQHIDAMGRTGAKEDGEVNTPSPQGNPNESIAANLRVYYNPSTRKYESGTAQILGRMVDDLGPAKATDLDKVLKLTVKDLQSPDNQHMVTIGEAIPIINQNANPLLWAPEYGESKNCRSSNDKNKLTVYNVSHKRFKKGETVLLQNIGGAWVPSSLGEPDTGGTGSFTGKWAFTYLMTNADAFFRNISGELLTYNAYEQGVHNMYYSDDEWSATSTKNAASIIDVFNGYYHVTSFDFMGKNICGTRDLTVGGTNSTDAGNSISCTQFSIDPKGDNLENGGKFLNGKTSGPFFGCVFPDGYSTSDDTGEKITTYTFGTPEIKSFQFDWMLQEYGPKALMFSETEASVDTAVFANKNDNKMNTSAANKLGMFYALYSETPTYDLKHLPADIGTNASPVGKNGYPITNLNHVWPAFKPYGWSAYDGASKDSGPQLTPVQFRDQVTNLLFHLIDEDGQTRYGLDKYDFTIPGSPDTYYYTRHNWLYLNTVSPTKLIDSAFDLKPAVPNRLQFRPLKAEVFASWEKPKRDSTMMSPTNKNVIKSKGIEAPRGVYGSLCWELLESESPVISYASLTRNNRGWRNWLFWWPEYGEWQDIAYGAPDVHGNVPIVGTPKWYIGPSLRYSNDICYRWQKGTAPNDAYYKNDLDNPRHPAYNVGQFFKTGNDVFAKCYIDTDANACIPWWSRYWNIGGKISQRENTNGLSLRGAGGIGIIAAQAELKAFKGVTFTTENYLGVRSYYQNKKWMPSWGFQNSYNSQNTISLHAKIMHKWPRGLTIYDPRFFATFHFNPPGAWMNNPKPTWYNGTEVIEAPATPPAAGGEEFPEGIYKVDNITSSVDTRVPTLNNGSIVPYYTYVYADIGLLGEQPCTLRNPEYWNVNYNRRNKLLPYKYKIPTIAIPAVLTDDAASNEAEVLVGSKVASNCKSIVILNGGKNYKPTDTFTTVGGPPSVKHATLLPILNNGSIIGFKYDTKKITRNIGGQITTYDDPQCGYGFYPSHFADKDDVIDGNYTFKIKIIPVVANGTGFAGGVIRGIVVLSPVIEDAKPAYATSSEVYEISAKPPSEGNVSAAKYDAGGSIESTVIKEVDKIISVTAGITNPSPDNDYDVFLFFHNDISFAMMETWNGVAGVEPVSQENHITVTIDPT